MWWRHGRCVTRGQGQPAGSAAKVQSPQCVAWWWVFFACRVSCFLNPLPLPAYFRAFVTINSWFCIIEKILVENACDKGKWGASKRSNLSLSREKWTWPCLKGNAFLFSLFSSFFVGLRINTSCMECYGANVCCSRTGSTEARCGHGRGNFVRWEPRFPLYLISGLVSSINGLIDWLIDWLNDWLIDWLIWVILLILHGYVSDINDDQKAYQDVVKKFAREEIAPKAAHYDKTGEVRLLADINVSSPFNLFLYSYQTISLFHQYPWEIVKKAFDLGLLNSHIPPVSQRAFIQSINYIAPHHIIHNRRLHVCIGIWWFWNGQLGRCTYNRGNGMGLYR